MKFECDGQIFEDEADLWMDLASTHSTQQSDGTDKCDICGETFEDLGDLGMHLAWGHHLAKRIPETSDEIRMEQEFQAIPKNLSEEERFRHIHDIVHGKGSYIPISGGKDAKRV